MTFQLVNFLVVRYTDNNLQIICVLYSVALQEITLLELIYIANYFIMC